ncbi:MAG TPA: glycosyltransferase family 2 protein [Candidatus Dormibacteraeota bacterium]|nr:glycosyltransferase family 2 protein [Candidatus Dormibacteraeota bacterium]
MKISIIIPVYNEFRTLPELLNRVLSAPLPRGCTKEIIVVDDGSKDGTALVVKDYAERGIVIGQYTFRNGGKGAAIRAGLELVSGDVVLVQDGDLEYDPNDYISLISPVVDGQADVVYGSRFRGTAIEMALLSLIANKVLTFIANSLYAADISDEATAYKAFRAVVLHQLILECNRFEFCPEVTAKLCRLGYRIHEVPISYRARKMSEGKKVRARDGFRAVWTLLKYRFVPKNTLLRSSDRDSAAILGEKHY